MKTDSPEVKFCVSTMFLGFQVSRIVLTIVVLSSGLADFDSSFHFPRLKCRSGVSIQTNLSHCTNFSDWNYKFVSEYLPTFIEERFKLLRNLISTTPPSLREKNLLLLSKNECEVDALICLLNVAHKAGIYKTTRDTAIEVNNKLNTLKASLYLDPDLNEFLNVLRWEAACLPEKRNFQYLLEKMLVIGDRYGITVNEIDRDRIADLNEKLMSLESDYMQKMSEVDVSILISPESLAGVDPRLLEGLEMVNDSLVYRMSPNHDSIVKQCEDFETKIKLIKFGVIGNQEQNMDIIMDLIELRKEKASLLGYKSFAAFAQEVMMAKDPYIVENFMRSMAQKLFPLWEVEREKILRFQESEAAQRRTSWGMDSLSIYDVLYFKTIYEDNINTDETNSPEEYFPLNKVLPNMLDLLGKFLRLLIIPIRGLKWDNKVMMYKVFDQNAGGDAIGMFYLDLFYRPGKFDQASTELLQPSCLGLDGKKLPVGVLLLNLIETSPMLLSYLDMTVLFHELGHIMHMVSSQVNFSNLGMDKMEMDFVEAPSQILEYWLQDPDILIKISHHFQDGTQIPPDLVGEMLSTNNPLKAYDSLDTIVSSMLDLRAHTMTYIDLNEEYRKLLMEFLNISYPDDVNYPTLLHMGSQYGATYYSYLWSEVYSSDLYMNRLTPSEILNPNSTEGLFYREAILKKGGSMDAVDMLRNYLGRNPTSDAFMRLKFPGRLTM